MKGMKLHNEYAGSLNTYSRMPKAVLAAVAYAFAARIFETTDADVIESAILHEWQLLHDNGIVPQEPRS